MNASQLKSELRQAASAEKARVAARFFKTGKGEYGEGDRFLGVMTPEQRRIVKTYFATRDVTSRGATLSVVRELLRGEYHEERFTALLILVEHYKNSSDEDRKRIFDFYLRNLDRVNNWDLVDLSAPNIVGAYLLDKDTSVIFTLAESEILWRRRVAILATLAFIKEGRFDETLLLAKRLLVEKRDRHDLMHKAVGWMLREVGKRDQRVLEELLDRFAARLPRTALRYAIERFSETNRLKYLKSDT